jgi:MFS family permease
MSSVLTERTTASPRRWSRDHPGYKWVALSNTTVGMLLATVNSSIVLISLPAIFRGIGLDPLAPGNISYLLWMIMGFLLVSAALVVTLGRMGDMYGRVKIYSMGFVVFAVSSVALALVPFGGGGAALWLIGWRVVQGVGGAMLFANSTAILTDAFPAHQRGMALGTNQVAAIGGSFIGLVLGGVLAEWHWRSVFWVSVPIAVLGAVWSYRSLHELGEGKAGKIDWWGNVTFAVGLSVLLAGMVYGINPYGGHPTGWTNPWVLAGVVGGVVILAAFCVLEAAMARRGAEPMFHIQLFRNRLFALGSVASLVAAVGRGGLQFILIIWLQGIWLPLHGFDYESTPLWAGIYLLPLTVGFLAAGPVCGILSDRYGARAFATGGLVVVALSMIGLMVIPVDFSYWVFAALLLLNGIGSGMFSSPNTSAVMSSVPPEQRGAASGMRATFLNSGSALSIGIFFTFMIVGLAGSLPGALRTGLTGQGIPSSVADQVAGLPPVGSLFAAFLGFNPIQQLLGPSGVLTHLPAANVATLTGKEFFPQLISGPFQHGLFAAFLAALIMTVIGVVASALQGKERVADLVEPIGAPAPGPGLLPIPAPAGPEEDIRDPLLRALLDEPALALRAAANLRTSQRRLVELRESMDEHRTQLAEAIAQLREAGLSQSQVSQLAGGHHRALADPLIDAPKPSRTPVSEPASAPRPTYRPSPTPRSTSPARPAPTARPRPTPSVRPTPSPRPRANGQWDSPATETSTPRPEAGPCADASASTRTSPMSVAVGAIQADSTTRRAAPA